MKHPKRPRRWLRPLVSVIAGGVISCVVAWAIVLLPHNVPLSSWTIDPSASRTDLTARQWRWWFDRQAGLGITRWRSGCTGTILPDLGREVQERANRGQGLLPQWLAGLATEREEYLVGRHYRPELAPLELSNELRTEHFFDELAGWPLACLRFEMVTSQTPMGDIISGIRGGIQLPWRMDTGGLPAGSRGRPGDRVGALPCLPVWTGLAVNALVYAPVVWVVMFVPDGVRRWRRRRRGACESCGYDRRGLGAAAACPECGRAPVPQGA